LKCVSENNGNIKKSFGYALDGTECEAGNVLGRCIQGECNVSFNCNPNSKLLLLLVHSVSTTLLQHMMLFRHFLCNIITMLFLFPRSTSHCRRM